MNTAWKLPPTALLWVFAAASALANPAGGVVVPGGTATITPGANLLTISQTSDRAIINWNTFNIANGETTVFQFNGTAGANSAVLNRVAAGNPSTIAGMLRSTVGPGGPVGGTVLILNPNGILFTPTAQINVGSLVATTLRLADDNQFLNNTTLSLSGSSTAGIQNQGNLSALRDIYLIAHTVQNAGNITAGDHAGLAAGTTVTLAQSGAERLTVVAGTPGTGAANGVENTPAAQINAVTAELKAAGGNIYALAINNGGAVRANSFVNEGGHIYLRASGGNIQNSGTLSAKNANGSGGTILVDGGHNAATPATVINSGNIEARGDVAGTKGGTVELVGDHVGLFDNALVDVSGEAGGGTVLIGGDYRGQNPNIQNAQASYVGPGAQIKADAVSLGDGGKAVVWSDGTTRFYGSISARGGAQGGNGGSVETSGHHLDFQGRVSTLAPLGAVGSLLLDPTDLTIDNNPDLNTTPANPFSPTASPSHLSWATIDTALGLSDVSVTTVGSPDSGTEVGNITVAAASPALNRNNKLTLDAAAAIAVNAGSTIVNSGTGDLELKAVGAVTIDANITLGGNLSVSGAGITSSGALVVKSATLAAGAGNNITLGNAANDFTSVAINSGNDVTLNDVNGITLGASTMSGNLIVAASSGITLSGDITSGRDQTYNNGVTLGVDAVLTGAKPTFGSTVKGGDHDLTLNFSGATVIDGATFTGIKNLTTGNGGSTTLSGDLTTSGAQTYNDDVALSGGPNALTGTTVVMNGNVTGGNNNLTVTADVTLGGTAANTVSGLGTFTVIGTTTLNAGSVDSGVNSQTYGGAVTLSGGAKTLTATTVAMNGNLTGGGNDLKVDGSATLGSTAADTVSSLGTLNVSGNTTLNAGTVSAGAVTVGGNATVNSGTVDAGAVTVGGNATVNSGTINAGSVAVSGTTALNGANQQITTTGGSQTYQGDVTLSGGAKTLTGTTVAMNGNLIGGGNDLTVAGNAVLGDAVADKVNNLGALTVSENATLNAGTVSASSVTVTKTGSLNTGVSVVATGDQTYNGVVNAAGGDTLKGSTLTFGGGLDAGSQGLNVILNVGGHLGVTGTPIIALNHNNTIANANTDHGLWAAGTQVFDGLSGLLWSGVGSFAADDTFRRLLGAVLPDVKKGNVKPTQAARGKGVAKPALVPVEGSFREQLTAQQ